MTSTTNAAVFLSGAEAPGKIGYKDYTTCSKLEKLKLGKRRTMEKKLKSALLFSIIIYDFRS